MKRNIRILPKGIILAAAAMGALVAGTAHAGDVYLTGHDTLLHNGQNGYDAVILDFLRGSTAKADYHIGVIGTASTGSGRFTGNATNIPGVGHGGAIPLAGTIAGYGSATFYDAATMTGAEFAGLSAIVVLSHVNCGGCSLTTAGSTALNALAGDIATAFNDGMDIWGNSGANLATYYDFLPPGAATGGLPIGGSSGFEATAAGLAIGIESPGGDMINGHPTHNRFVDFAAAFTVMEIRPQSTGPDEVISIGLKDGVITDDGIIISDDGTPPPPPPPGVPDNGMTLVLLGLALPCLAGLRRKFRR